MVDDINAGELLGDVEGFDWVVDELYWLADALVLAGVLLLFVLVDFLLALH